ncbi:MAG: carbonic anhydrase [Desulfovibrionaceae bacterium]
MPHRIAKFITGFKRFQENYFCADPRLFGELRTGQRPKVLMIACSDSRVDPAILTGCEPGDIFVVRNVGSLVPPYAPDAAYHGISAAIEYAIRKLEVEHAIVLGHSCCGGIHALLAGPDKETEFIDQWMNIAAPAKARVDEALAGAEPEIRAKACEEAAVLVSLENLLSFPWVRRRVDEGRLMLHGWYFDLGTGDLLGYLPQTGAFEPLVTQCEAAKPRG